MRVLWLLLMALAGSGSLWGQSLEFGLGVLGAPSRQGPWGGVFSVTGLGGAGPWVAGGFGSGWVSDRFQAGTGGLVLALAPSHRLRVGLRLGLGGASEQDHGAALATWGAEVVWVPGAVVGGVVSWDHMEPWAGDGHLGVHDFWSVGVRFRIP